MADETIQRHSFNSVTENGSMPIDNTAGKVGMKQVPKTPISPKHKLKQGIHADAQKKLKLEEEEQDNQISCLQQLNKSKPQRLHQVM